MAFTIKSAEVTLSWQHYFIYLNFEDSSLMELVFYMQVFVLAVLCLCQLTYNVRIRTKFSVNSIISSGVNFNTFTKVCGYLN